MQKNIELTEQYGPVRTLRGIETAYNGEIEFIFRDPVTKQEFRSYRERNIIKIAAKEIFSHRLPYNKVWDPTGGSGSGAWVSSGIDPAEELAVKYIVFGASFDSDNNPLDTSDPRFYSLDSASGGYVPIRLGPGAEYDGGLINAIPIAEPSRPLKRIERIYFESSYQPAGTPLLQDDVRALNNVVVMETTLRKDEYNGFGTTSTDFFTITEVALVAGKELDATGACECNPHTLFLEGSGDDAIAATATGTATITLLPEESPFVNTIKEGDTIKIVPRGGTVGGTDDLDQISPYYLVISKAVSGSDIILDRTPAASDGTPIAGPIGVFKDGFRIFSHRVLNTPVKKSEDFEIVVRWRIIMG